MDEALSIAEPFRHKTIENGVCKADEIRKSPEEVGAVLEGLDNAQTIENDNLTSKLKVALKEIITKDNLVKQHAKVAEDAISGWEKAEAEAAFLKQQLDNAMQQKLGLEERVVHLDGALKECVKQLRNGKEEHEQKQEGWETMRSELEAKLSEAERTLHQAASENAAKADSFEQRISALSDAKSQAESEAKKVSTKVETLEKENMNLKHDVRALKKDLVALNNDSKKTSEGAKQQLGESARKISRLEAECLKLKTQLRKRSSGSAASQARLEGEGLDRRKSLGRLTSSPRAFSVDGMDDCSEMSNRDMDDKLEEETKSLKEELAKKNRELLAARIMCTRTAGRLSNVEEQLGSICGAQDISLAGLSDLIETLRQFGNNQQSSIGFQGSCNGDESDVWASALVAELAQLNKEEKEKKPDKLFDTTSFDLMDDFLEMEKLTSNHPHQNGQSPGKGDAQSEFAKKGKELDAAKEQIMVLSNKVATLENQLIDKAQTDVIPCSNGDADHETTKDLDLSAKPKMISLICKIIRTIELLADKAGLEHEAKPSEADSDSNSLEQDSVVAPGMQWVNVDINAGFESLASAGNALLQGSTDLRHFIEEVSCVLERLASLKQSKEEPVPNDSSIESLHRENVLLGNQLSHCQATLATLEAEMLVLDNALKDSVAACAKVTAERDEQKVRAEELKEKLAAKAVLIEQLTSTIAALEEDVNVAEERAHSTVKGLSATFEEDLCRVKSEREAAQKRIEAMDVVLSELQDQKSKLEEDATTQLKRIALLEDELKRGRSDKLAAQKDMDAVNEDIQKLMADFIQLQHEKQDLETALVEAKQQTQKESIRTTTHLDNVARLEEDLRKSLEQRDQSKSLAEEARVKLHRFALREDALQKTMSEKEEKQIEMLVRIEKMNEERTQMVARIEDLVKKSQDASELVRIEQGRVSALKEDVNRLELQNVRLEDRLNQSDENSKTQEASFMSLQNEFYQLKIEKEDTEQSFLMADQDVQQLRARLATLDEECRRLKAENAKLEDGLKLDVERVKGDFDRSDRELRVVNTEREKLSGELEELTRIVQEMKAECADKEAELLVLRNINEELEQNLSAVTANVRELKTECITLETERSDLEHVLSATNEIVQGVKEECSRLSTAEEKLEAENQELLKRLTAAEERMKSVAEDMKNLEADKAELEHDLALSQVTWKSQVFEAEELVASLRAELALSAKSKQLAEDQLTESFSAKAELQYQVKAALHEGSQLNEKTKALEEELGSEKTKGRAIAAELEELRKQLSRQEENWPATSSSKEVCVSDKNNTDLSEKLDECHRAILSLGEQLQTLSMSNKQHSSSPTEPSSSEESISTVKAKDEFEGLVAEQSETQQQQQQQQQNNNSEMVENGVENSEGKVFVPSLPLEGRPRSKSTSPGKSKLSKSSGSKDLDVSKSLDMSSSPSEKSSSSGFSRFFRGKSSSSSHHHS